MHSSTVSPCPDMRERAAPDYAVADQTTVIEFLERAARIELA